MKLNARLQIRAIWPLFVLAVSLLAQQTVVVNGVWTMTFQKRGGGQSYKILTLKQNGNALEGTIKDEGGELAVAGKIDNSKLHLEGHHTVTVKVDATLDNQNRMSGTFDVLSVHRTWTGERHH